MDEPKQTADAIASASKQFARVGISFREAADGMRRFSDAARYAMTDDEMIANIKLNPSLTYMEKVNLIRKIKDGAK